jgi:hypothetical protein
MKKENYKVYWIGIVEGYGIDLTNDEVNQHDVFRLWSEAKKKAVENSKNDVDGAKKGLVNTRSLRK